MAEDPAQAVALAAELGHDVTEEELLAAEAKLRGPADSEVVELDLADMDKVAGGAYWYGDDAPDGHEMGCDLFYHGYEYSVETGNWCTNEYYEQNDIPCLDMNRMTDAASCRIYGN